MGATGLDPDDAPVSALSDRLRASLIAEGARQERERWRGLIAIEIGNEEDCDCGDEGDQKAHGHAAYVLRELLANLGDEP